MDCKRHLLIVAGLLGLACLVQVVVIRRAATTGLDAVRFVQIARSIDRQGLLETVRAQREQPLFPAWIWVVHGGLQRTSGEFPSIWAVSAQLAAAVPLVLAVVPLYLLLLRLVGGAAALAGSFFFCLLPEVARLGADGISDSTHLLFFCVAFWAMVQYLGRRKAEGGRRKGEAGPRKGVFTQRLCPPLWLLLAGAAVAVAALARAEVLVLAAALGLTLAVFQLLPGRREPGRRLAAASTCFLLGLAVVWTPYLAATGAVTPRTAARRILGRHRVEPHTPRHAGVVPADLCRLPDGEPMSFDAKERSVSLRQRGYPAAVARFGKKLADAAGYWIGALALLGAWRLRGIRARCQEDCDGIGRASAGDRFVQVFFLLFSVIVIRFSASEGYLVPRHLLTLVVAGLGAAGCGALELGALLARVARAVRPAVLTRRRTGEALADKRPVVPRQPPVGKQPGGPRRIAWAVVAVTGMACLPQTLIRLHDSRLGHRAAGKWLAGQDDLSGTVLDTQGWTGLYSGRETYAFEEAPAALSDPRLAYLVVEHREVEYRSGRSRTLRWLIESGGEPVAEFPDPDTRSPHQQPVIVYRWHADRFLGRTGVEAGRSAQAGGDVRREAGAAAGGEQTGIAASAAIGVDSRPVLRAAGPQPKS
jgi:4-amino-4-deoxy-L-arabinose transferase-like glycosyltransferase